MTGGIIVDFLWFPIGTDSFLYSFFSTICYRLEHQKWGKKFPVVMNELYSGSLSCNSIKTCRREIETIEKKFKRLSSSAVVWSLENLDEKPPWGEDISGDITNLAEYFITCDGKNLFDVLKAALKEAEVEQVDVRIEKV